LLRSVHVGFRAPDGGLDQATQVDKADKYRLFPDIMVQVAMPLSIISAIFVFMGNYHVDNTYGNCDGCASALLVKGIHLGAIKR
jgi:hypothetical protein